MSKHELLIINRGKVYFPSVIEPITFDDEREGSPSKLTFTVVKDQELNFQEGNPVRYIYDGHKIFFGFVFTKRRGRDHHIEVTCFDQIRYLLNKDSMVLKNVTASDVIRKINAINPSLQLGKIDNTGVKIPSLVCDNETYLDAIHQALDYTITRSKKGYVLYDNFGKLTLSDIDGLKIDGYVVGEDNAEDFEYVTSIDTDTYNQVKLLYEDEEKGKREVYIAKDTNSINKWGLLQYFETIDEKTNGKLKADTLLKLHNRKSRNLKVSGLRGDPKVRAGFRIPVLLNLGDIITQNYLIIDHVQHNFNESHHTMDLVLIGGGFSA